MNSIKFIFLSNKLITRYLLVAFFILLIFQNFECNSQNLFRRHFIIACDASKSFNSRNPESIGETLKWLEFYFENNFPPGTDGKFDIIREEFGIQKVRFDPSRDEISFYNFNLTDNDITSIITGEQDSLKITSKIPELFFKNSVINWTTYHKQNIVEYVSDTYNPFRSNRELTNFTLPNLVYPLILNRVDFKSFAEEYILIILTKTTPEPLNIVDLYELKTRIGKENFAEHYLKNQIKILSSNFTKTEYFNYPDFGIFAYFITPKNVSPGTTETAVSIDSNIKLKQKGYESEKFQFSDIKMNFPQNESLLPSEINLKIIKQNKTYGDTIFSEIINKQNYTQRWSMRLLRNIGLTTDNSLFTYYIRNLKVNLEGIDSEDNFESLKLIFEIKTQIQTSDNNSMKYLFFTETLVPANNISFIELIKYIMINFVLPLAIFLFILIVIVIYGKPKGIKLAVNGYLDSFEIIDYVRFGKLHTPYKFWDKHLDSLVVDGKIIYKFPKYIFNWKSTVFVNLDSVSIPNGFDAYIKPKFESINEYHKGSKMSLRQTKNNKISFIICLKQNDIIVKIKEPQLIKIKISTWIRETRLFFIKKEIINNLEYNFHIGPDLGDVWVGLDPGTTGSCIAVGNQSNNVVIADDSSKIKVIDSKLIFEVSENYIQHNGEVPEHLYKFGTNARTKFGSEGVRSFQSIKKLLGFKDRKVIRFNNHNTLELTGKDLSALLVKGLYSELKKFNERINNVEYLHENKFNPKRAIIAIPNNFTISKIQDIIDCTRQLNQFEEIRYVYEAEAVLFYYLSQYSRFNSGKAAFNNENILVFDMGGATINASIVSATKTEENKKSFYDIDILGKIGYGIGGDTIDYCIIKFIKSYANEYPEFKNLIFNNINKENLVKTAQSIKLMVGNFFKEGFDRLIESRQLEDFLQISLKQPIKISDESKFYQSFTKDSSGNYKLFSHPIFVELIYNNVKDAVNEVIELSGNCKIDKVIFSGRSTFFPFVKETVEKQLKAAKNDAIKIVLNVEESKTAVAHGTCWYGINKNSIRLNNLKTNASFGVKKTLSSDTKDVAFMEMVKMGCAFDNYNAGIDQVKGEVFLSDDFSFDGAKVNFFQIMGKNADKILAENQKHKFSKIASIRIPLAITAIQMIVSENDEIECKAKLINNEIIVAKGVVSDQDITDANEEHYTWIVK